MNDNRFHVAGWAAIAAAGLMPAAFIALGIAFLRPEERLEFV